MKDPKGAAERLKLRALVGDMDSRTLRDIASVIAEMERLQVENQQYLELVHTDSQNNTI